MIFYPKPWLLSYTSRINMRLMATTTANDIQKSHLVVELSKSQKVVPPKETLVFGRTFTEHMLEIPWTAREGWGTPKILPHHPLSLDPACSVFHYGVECFEGMKAYKDRQGQIRMFRPQMNMERMNRSAARVSLPNFNGNEFLGCIKELLKVESRWIPADRGYSLYIRPTMIGTQPVLGVGPSEFALLYVICCPVGPYYKSGFNPVKLLADTKYARAWPGGTGDTKLGGNYGPTILAQIEAQRQGAQQVMWLFGPDKEITEVGTMNLFAYMINEQGEKELVTAPLDGTILPGVTRDSILSLTRQWKEFKVSERKWTMKELNKALAEKRVLEMFGAGTAAIVSPVYSLIVNGQEIGVPLDASNPTAKAGPLANRLAEEIMAIQYGEKPHPWSVVVS